MKTCIMVRKIDPLRWVKYGEFPTLMQAERAHRDHISGRGITAWSVFVDPDTAKKMEADPDHVPGLERKTGDSHA